MHEHDQQPGPAQRTPVRTAGTPAAAPAPPQHGPTDPTALLALQRLVGNRVVARALEQEQHQHGEGCGHGAPVQRSAVGEVLSSAGSPLPDGLRTEMEGRLGADFSDVRLHTGTAAQRSAAEIGARAYTSGRDVVIGAGGADRHTLAHELTHVIQQRQGPVAGTDNGQGLSISDPSDRFEREAEANAHRVLAGPVPAQRAVASAGGGGAGPGVVQRRSENPYGLADKPLPQREHMGWDLTAHHIVPHSKLVQALDGLSDEDRDIVLRHGIPDTITASMLNNLKVRVVEGEDAGAVGTELQALLVDPAVPDGQVFREMRIGELRLAFFEWQGGNQFFGPNTSIRPEPSDAKDDIDHDGRYFSSLDEEQFGALLTLGQTVRDGNANRQTLTDMLDLTRNAAPAVFSAQGWAEVADLDEIGQLAAHRAHIRHYAFFKFSLAQVGQYPELQIGGGKVRYRNVESKAQLRGTYGYIPLTDAQTAETSRTQTPLASLFPDAVRADGEVRIPTARVTVTGRNFEVNGFPGQRIPHKGADDTGVVVQAGLFDKRMLNSTTQVGPSLYDYCIEQHIPTSTYLPRELYDQLMAGAQ